MHINVIYSCDSNAKFDDPSEILKISEKFQKIVA